MFSGDPRPTDVADTTGYRLSASEEQGLLGPTPFFQMPDGEFTIYYNIRIDIQWKLCDSAATPAGSAFTRPTFTEITPS